MNVRRKNRKKLFERNSIYKVELGELVDKVEG